MKRLARNAFAHLMLCGALTGCGGGASSDTAAHGADTAALSSQIQALEASGRLPALDRSSSLRGPDQDNNGIRDDIDAWIAALPITDAQKKAARQSARVRQAELLADLNSMDQLDQLGNRSMASLVCLSDAFAPERQRGRELSRDIEAITANTRERARQYLAYNRVVSGSSGRLPEGNTCEP